MDQVRFKLENGGNLTNISNESSAGDRNSDDSSEKQQQMLANELMRVSGQLEISQKVRFTLES